MNNGRLPNCLIIGAMKAGTTSLHNYLAAHPDVFGSRQKELDFFVAEKNWKNGVDWYKNQFKSDAKILLESSQNYTKRHSFQGVPQRIMDLLGNDIKLIYIVREPIARIRSHFMERLTGGYAETNSLQESFNQFLTQHPLGINHYIQCSKYYYQIKPYIDQWGKDKIYVLTTDSLYRSPLSELNKVFRFLGVKELEELEALNKKYNVSSEKRYPVDWYKNYRYKIFNPLTKPFINYANSHQWFTKKVKKENWKLTDELTNQIREVLKDDVNNIANEFDLDISEWGY